MGKMKASPPNGTLLRSGHLQRWDWASPYHMVAFRAAGEKTMRNAILAGLVLASAGLAPMASAQQPEMIIAFLDKNGDGKCDLNEYLGFQVSRLAQVDKDGDGELNQAEFRESLQGKAKANAAMMFKGANTEGGRTLSQREFLGYNAWVFQTYVDADKDGFMSQEEWTSIMSKAG